MNTNSVIKGGSEGPFSLTVQAQVNGDGTHVPATDTIGVSLGISLFQTTSPAQATSNNGTVNPLEVTRSSAVQVEAEVPSNGTVIPGNCTNDLKKIVTTVKVDIGSTIVGSLDVWNGISVTIDLPLQNPLAFDITLTAVELSFLYNDPDGSSVAPFGSYPPGNDLVLVDNFKQQLDPAVTIEAGQTGLIKGLQYTVESGAVEIIARIYDEVALKKRLCGSIRNGALSIAVAATNSTAAFQLEQPFEFENLSILGTAACVQNSTCTPAAAPLFEYSGVTQTAVTLVGDAAVARNVGQLQLTNSKTEQISAVWTVNKLQVLDDWSVTFDFKMSPGALAIGGFGDGLAFVVHSAAANAIGERCNGDAYCMGYRGIEQSLAVELKGGTA
eukprot:14744-Heterococcus_DN1.PRE.2